MTNANALPIQVATDETVSMAHYNAAMDAKQARIDALEKALEWVESNYRATLSGDAVRDADECLAFSRAALGEGE